MSEFNFSFEGLWTFSLFLFSSHSTFLPPKTFPFDDKMFNEKKRKKKLQQNFYFYNNTYLWRLTRFHLSKNDQPTKEKNISTRGFDKYRLRCMLQTHILNVLLFWLAIEISKRNRKKNIVIKKCTIFFFIHKEQHYTTVRVPLAEPINKLLLVLPQFFFFSSPSSVHPLPKQFQTVYRFQSKRHLGF